MDEVADPVHAEKERRFFKEEIKHRGVTGTLSLKIAKRYADEFKKEKLTKSEIFELCDELWKSEYLDEMRVACEWSESQKKLYERSDIDVFERWIRLYVHNWAACDTLCNHTVGDLVSMYPELIERLLIWADDENLWVKRAAAVTLIIPARRGEFLEYIFKIADKLLTDTEDMVRKGYGWMLKAASEAHETEVFEYVTRNKSVMPRTSLRYAIEKMNPEYKKSAMEK
jgi:3-methyladenine DNA glycosylase AlkD